MADAGILFEAEPIPLVVRSADAEPAAGSSSDDPLIEAAITLASDVVAVIVIQTLSERNLPLEQSLETLVPKLRPTLVDRIQVLRHGWGSWEALLAVPPDAVVWALHEIGIPIGSAVLVRVGEEVLHRLRVGTVDSELVERIITDIRFDLELRFPNGGLLKFHKRTHQVRQRSERRGSSQIKPRIASPKRRGRKGKKPRLK